MYERETQWIRGWKGTANAEEGCVGKKKEKVRKKKKKKKRSWGCKRKGKTQDYICHLSLPAHSEKLQKRSGNREEKKRQSDITVPATESWQETTDIVN